MHSLKPIWFVCVFVLLYHLNAFSQDPYQVVWTSPGPDFNASVPLGNGEVGLNAWVNSDGDLEFFISRTDSWDEHGRLLKVGGIKVCMPCSAESGNEIENFVQTLDTRNGCLRIQYTIDGRQRNLCLWVDANRPVVVLEIDSNALEGPRVTSTSWRTQPETMLLGEVSDVPYRREVVCLPDVTVSPDLLDSNMFGWYHDNGSSTPDFDKLAQIQGTDEFRSENPLKNRIFGAIVSSGQAKYEDGELRLNDAKHHVIEICVNTCHPSTPDSWVSETRKILRDAQKVPVATRFAESKKWWNDFQNRSWIHLSESKIGKDTRKSEIQNKFWSGNVHPLRLGLDSLGGSAFSGTFESVKVLSGKEVLYHGENVEPREIPDSATWKFPDGGEIIVSFKIRNNTHGYQRILDKITAGASDGFLVDLSPEGKLRVIFKKDIQFFEIGTTDGSHELCVKFDADGICDFFLDSVKLDRFGSNLQAGLSETFVVERGYLLQRYVDACGGRGNFAIKYNGSIFTVPFKKGTGCVSGYADYRRWGPGYWWQNSRLPYISKNMAGDFDLQETFFRQYLAILPLCESRTKKYLACEGAYFPECIYFWGDVFPETYGKQPWNERKDRLQSSGWHKWEWVGGLELAYMALQYYDYTGDRNFLQETAIPLADATTRFFDSFYETDPQTGKLVMHPSQSLETWWNCTNPMPEVAGLHAVLKKLKELPENTATAEQRARWNALSAKIPPIPVWTDPEGVERFAPAEKFASKSNIENGELYCVFPFRLVDFTSPDAALARAALDKRWDRGAIGWRQDDLFMTYLGLADEARVQLVERARNFCPSQRFPAFWGPNYDWTPDQCHGGILTATLQSMILQVDGRKLYLAPALPKEWNVDFRLHAPYQTVLEGRIEEGKVVELRVTPEERRKDVILVQGSF